MWIFLEGLGMENVGLFYDRLVYTVEIWHFLWKFGIFCGNLAFSVEIWYKLWKFGIFCGNLV
jgi:hypothetical protein